MPVMVECSCGKSYDLKDEFAGKALQCAACGTMLKAGLERGGVYGDTRSIFDRDKFLFSQKHLAISEKYYVAGEDGQNIMYVERPAHFGHAMLALLGGLVAGGLVFALFSLIGSFIRNTSVYTVIVGVGGLAAMLAVLLVAVLLGPKRHVNFYRDDRKLDKLLEVLQDHKLELLNANFTVLDAGGQVLARLRKYYLSDVFRKCWYCFAPNSSVLCIAKEESILLSLLRRLIGPLFGLLRVNFVLLAPGEQKTLGEFNRKFTLLDRYVLDLSSDPDHKLDRRVAVAIGVMLDTGERR